MRLAGERPGVHACCIQSEGEEGGRLREDRGRGPSCFPDVTQTEGGPSDGSDGSAAAPRRSLCKLKVSTALPPLHSSLGSQCLKWSCHRGRWLSAVTVGSLWTGCSLHLSASISSFNLGSTLFICSVIVFLPHPPLLFLSHTYIIAINNSNFPAPLYVFVSLKIDWSFIKTDSRQAGNPISLSLSHFFFCFLTSAFQVFFPQLLPV